MSLTVGEVRRLTEGLDDDMEFLCAGAPVQILWHVDEHISVDDDAYAFELPEGATVLYGPRDEDEEDEDDDG